MSHTYTATGPRGFLRNVFQRRLPADCTVTAVLVSYNIEDSTP